MKIHALNRIAGVCLILLSILITLPLTIKTIVTNGGTWGFGMIGLAILLPLNTYVLFGIAGLINDLHRQQILFILSHVLSIIIGLAALFIFPLYPMIIVAVPIALSMVSFLDSKHFGYYLFLMITLAILANAILLKWEIDFGRSIPLLQLFQSNEGSLP
jgi:hypothetical protein